MIHRRQLILALVPTTTARLLKFIRQCVVPNRGYINVCLIDLPFVLHRILEVGHGTVQSITCCQSQWPKCGEYLPSPSRSRSEPFLGLASQAIDRLLHPQLGANARTESSPPFTRPSARQHSGLEVSLWDVWSPVSVV